MIGFVSRVLLRTIAVLLSVALAANGSLSAMPQHAPHGSVQPALKTHPTAFWTAQALGVPAAAVRPGGERNSAWKKALAELRSRLSSLPDPRALRGTSAGIIPVPTSLGRTAGFAGSAAWTGAMLSWLQGNAGLTLMGLGAPALDPWPAWAAAAVILWGIGLFFSRNKPATSIPVDAGETPTATLHSPKTPGILHSRMVSDPGDRPRRSGRPSRYVAIHVEFPDDYQTIGSLLQKARDARDRRDPETAEEWYARALDKQKQLWKELDKVTDAYKRRVLRSHLRHDLFATRLNQAIARMMKALNLRDEKSREQELLGALADLHEAPIRHDSERAQAHNLRSEILFSLARWEKAREEAEKAIKAARAVLEGPKPIHRQSIRDAMESVVRHSKTRIQKIDEQMKPKPPIHLGRYYQSGLSAGWIKLSERPWLAAGLSAAAALVLNGQTGLFVSLLFGAAALQGLFQRRRSHRTPTTLSA